MSSSPTLGGLRSLCLAWRPGLSQLTLAHHLRLPPAAPAYRACVLTAGPSLGLQLLPARTWGALLHPLRCTSTISSPAPSLDNPLLTLGRRSLPQAQWTVSESLSFTPETSSRPGISAQFSSSFSTNLPGELGRLETALCTRPGSRR